VDSWEAHPATVDSRLAPPAAAYLDNIDLHSAQEVEWRSMFLPDAGKLARAEAG
jgi:hypothetical protein